MADMAMSAGQRRTPRKPSEYMRERVLHPKGAPVLITDRTHVPVIVELVRDREAAMRSCEVPLDRPLFHPEPSNISLQSYLPFKTYELVINFRNMDKFARKLRLEPIDSAHFSVHGWNTNSLNSGKVAPGMEIPFIVKFKPEENVDYVCNLVCETEREKFLLPIRAIGARGVLDLPDEIVFGDCPVNYNTTKTLLVRNIGNAPAKFEVEAAAPFAVVPRSGFLEIGKSLQIDVSFFSKQTGSFESSLEFKYDSGEVVLVRAAGTSDNANIKLERSSLRMESTSITLISSKSVRIFNRSDIMARFCWKLFANEMEDEHFRAKQLLLSMRDEQQERESYKAKTSSGQKSELVDLSLLVQKYKASLDGRCAAHAIAKQQHMSQTQERIIHKQTFPFDDPIFSIEPLEGVIWPGAFCDVKILFSPETAGDHSCIAYCEVEGRATRLPLQLKGEALGPKVRFSYDLLDLESVFINTSHKYEVVLENKGEIAAHFALEPSQTLFGPKFSFSPKQGTVEPGEQRVIEISFSSDLLGQFSEEFRWNFKGTLEPVLLSFKGIVVGPTFHFKPDILDFQSIAYGFPASRSLRLYNTSHIPMSFQLRLDSAEDVARAADFRLTPESGTVPEMSFVEIDVFIQPRSIQTIAFEIIVDVEGVGRDMSRLALYAESVVPEISVVSPIVNLEDCFLCYSYHGQIGLVNNSNFPAKYELLPQEETARGVFTYTSQSFSGIIEPHSQRPIAIEVQIKRLGQVNFPVFIKIAGKESAPIAVDIAANGIGPNVRLSSSELNWGRIPVLQHTPLKLVLSNESPIMAFFNCVTLTEGSAFSVMPIQGVIQPGTSFEITVTAYLDDTLKFTDILKVSVQSDGVHEVQLVARGQGTTIVFAEGLRRVDFKDVFSNRDCSAEFVLANKGLRSQTIHWTREETRLAPNRDPSAPASQVFEAIPARFTLRPGAHQTVFIRGFSSEAAAVCEKLTCQAMIDKDPSRKTVVETIVTANFINPLIELTPNVLRFEKTHMSEEIFEVLEQSLVLRNTTTLALSLAFKCPPPFHVGIPTDGLCLGPQESIVVPVQYDSAYNASRISSREHAKLVISYQEHPQRDVVELFSEISFPNLTFSANTLKFGCVEADQEQRRMLTISNTSVLPVSYHWYFVNDPKAPSFGPVSQIFDIQPLRGELQPGEKQEVEVYFYGQVGRSFQIKALCDVAGGPKYEVALLGEASTVEFAFDKTTLSFGTMSYQSMAEQEIVLSNTGQVHFDYSVIVLPSVPLAAKIVVTPSQGSIPPKGRQRILVRFCPCVPEAVNDRFFIQIAHFEPTEIHIVGASVFPRMTIDIPRVADPKFDQYIGELARKRGMREADASEIEAEAERLVLVDKMREFVQKLADEVRQKLSLAEIQRAKFAGSVVLYHKGVVHKAAKEKRTMNLSESSHVRLSRFLCDFGTVIRNTTARRTFRIFNSGSHALSFAVDKTALTGTGFSVDPDKIKSLPHGEGIEFTAQLHARHHATDALEVDVPISITGGPTVLLSLRAAITVPEIKLSDDKIDFGEVLCGYRKTFFVHVHNPSAVACEWAALTFDEEGGTKKSKKRANPQPAREFDIVPRNGQLLPGEKSTFMVRFSPLDEKEYDITLPIKLSMNPKACMLHLLGRGIRPLITFEPDSIVVGPVLPHSDGVEARFWIQNHIKYPIEVFSIDFDQQFRDEEEILKQVQLSEAQPLFLPPREPGSALPEFIVDYVRQKAKIQSQALQTPAITGTGPAMLLHSPPAQQLALGQQTPGAQLSSAQSVQPAQVQPALAAVQQPNQASLSHSAATPQSAQTQPQSQQTAAQPSQSLSAPQQSSTAMQGSPAAHSQAQQQAAGLQAPPMTLQLPLPSVLAMAGQPLATPLPLVQSQYFGQGQLLLQHGQLLQQPLLGQATQLTPAGVLQQLGFQQSPGMMLQSSNFPAGLLSQLRREAQDDQADGGLRRAANSDADVLDLPARLARGVMGPNMVPGGVHASGAGQPGSQDSQSAETVFSVILHGPPFCGRTTQAKRIAQHYGKAYINIDEIIEAAMPTVDASGSAIDHAMLRKDAASSRNGLTADEAGHGPAVLLAAQAQQSLLSQQQQEQQQQDFLLQHQQQEQQQQQEQPTQPLQQASAQFQLLQLLQQSQQSQQPSQQLLHELPQQQAEHALHDLQSQQLDHTQHDQLQDQMQDQLHQQLASQLPQNAALQQALQLPQLILSQQQQLEQQQQLGLQVQTQSSAGQDSQLPLPLSSLLQQQAQTQSIMTQQQEQQSQQAQMLSQQQMQSASQYHSQQLLQQASQRDRTNVHSKEGRDARDQKDEDGGPHAYDLAEEACGNIPEEVIFEIIRQRLRREGRRGYVIDGLECKYIAPIPLLRMLLKMLTERGRRVAVFHIGLDLAKIREREVMVQRILADKELEALQIRELSEEDYDQLNDQDRAAYDLAMRKYKRRAKEIEDRRRAERRHLEEDVTNRSGERRVEEDKAKGRKVRKPVGGRPTGPEKLEKAPNTSKSDGKGGKVAKAPGSPKTARKAGDRADRSNDKEQRAADKSDRVNASNAEKEGGDDVVSRFGIAEDTFLNETTFRRAETYFGTLEVFMSIMKESDKSTASKAALPVAPNPIDKKPKAAKASGVAEQAAVGATALAAAALSAAAPGQVLDADGHASDEPAVLYFDIAANAMDEDAVFKAECEHIPHQEEESHAGTDRIAPPILEQIFVPPRDRSAASMTRFFSLLPPVPASEDEEAAAQDAVPQPLPAVPAIVTSPSPAPAASSKQDSSSKTPAADQNKGDPKKAKPAVKAPDEAKPPPPEPEEDTERVVQNKFRWIFQPGERKELTLRFNPTDVGRFEQILAFETAGARGRFQLPCVGTCQYHHIVTDFRKIFGKWRRQKDEKTVLHGEYVVSTGTYEFGPLLSSKPKEKYLERFPENRATFMMINPCNCEIKIMFALRNDVKGDVFFFEPQTMDLGPGQTQTVSVWAYPRNNNHFEDTFVVSVKDNPEPYTIKLGCIGVRPELEIDKKHISFDKMLLGRSERREIRLRNQTHMSVAWKLTGVESLGEEFSITPAEGMVESFQEVAVAAEFKGIKPIVVKRPIRLEVCDAEKIGGIVQDVSIMVTAEAYDIAMDLHFPKSSDGGLEFGVLRVFEEGKQMCMIKNKGKYEVGYRFMFDDPTIAEFFVVAPTQGVLQPSDKPFHVQITFKTTTEMTIKESSSLKCVVYEPTTGEVTASIPIKINARAVFSKFSVMPVRDLNFGALVHGTKAARQITIENLGEFDFKVSIYKLLTHIVEQKSGSKPRTTSRPGKPVRTAASPPAAKVAVNRKEVVKPTDTVSFGAFSLSPTSGTVAPGAKLVITVEFHAETPGSYEEIIGLDVSDRSPADGADVLEYRLVGESCVPGINTTDFVSIFEELSVCKRLELFNSQSNVYAEEDRVFYFGAYLAGQQVPVQFKISNPFKVACDIAFSTKPRSKSKSDSSDFAFDVEPKKLTIPSHEYKCITVTFHPTSIQSYAGLFEATVENVAEGRNRTLTFELRGEGTLPRVVVDRPTLKSKSGLPLLKFKRLLVGSSQTLPLVLRNDGIIQAKFKLEWAVKDNDDIDCPLVNIYHSLRPQEVRTVDIKCRPSAVRRLEGELRLKVLDNSFEDSSIQVFGEGYIDDITFESMPEDAENEIVFADCFIGESKQMTFRMRNHCQEWIRLAVSESADFTFSPAVAHIKPHNDREITVTFSPKQPCEIQHAPLVIRATKIRLVSPQDIEWDERMKIVRWVGADGTARGPATRKVLEHLAEPIFEGLAPPSEYTMLLSAFADFSQYECDTSSVHFKSTLMFQSRVFRFSLRNPGKVMLRFTFTICNEDGSPVDAADNVPFSVTPAVGAIQANETFMIALRFSPEDVGDYRYLVVCSMPNLAKDQKLLQIPVHGTSLRPLCHFELEESDYVASERRNPDRGVTDGVPAVLEPNTKVIEFSSCGVRSKNMNRFYIVNPTNLSYEFVWSQESPKDTKVFKCFTPRGIVAPNKKSEIMFEFSPETIDIKASFESLWTFTILEHGIRIPFLLVGQAIEPNVYADHTNVNFKSVLVGRQVKEVVHLTNGELVPFAFAFSDTSFELGQQGTPVLRFSPSSGTIGPNSEIPIEIVFSPASEKTFNFNLVCNIRKKPTPVTINIKGEGYEIHDSLQTEIADGNVFELAASPAPDNMLDFGQVQLNEKRVKRVYIINSGKFNFDYAWKFAGSKTASMITITPEIGTVPRGERIFCEIAFMPTSAAAVRGVRAVCHIVNGRSYPIAISGTGTKPLIRFSDLNIDFGAEFVFRPGMTAATHALQITNSDTRDISIDIVSPDVSWMEIQRGLNTLGPEETTVYTLSFFPREQTVYSTAIKFEVNGLSTVDVAVRGEGVEHRIEADQRQLNFGALRVGHSSVRTLKLANKSKLAAQFSIGPASTIETLLSYGVHLSMYEDLTLRPKAALSVDLKFAPHRRIPAFAEELFIEAPGVSRQLAVVSGACQGVEVRLENDTLPFGAVVQRSSTMRRMQLQNIGDIGVKFFWDSQQFLPDFSISPTEGYISPGMDIPLEITFHPSEIHPDIRYENLSCNIDGVQSIYLTLTGMCIPQPQQTDAVKFASAVRSPDTKSIQLTNKTSAVWHVRPIIENDVWSGPEVIEIEPSATKSYDLTFVPLETNGSGEGGRHEGSVFFPLPDGSGILYKLYGTADKPLSAGNISREIPCKTSFTEVLSVTNWLKRPQRFKVVNEVAKPDPSVIIKGNDFVDVPPLLSKDYKLTFYSYKEGLTNLRVVFRNESTQEYQFYNLAYKSTPPGIMGYYEMTTAVRQLVTRDIAIFNPLQTPATFSGSTSNPDASVSHSFTIQPRSEGVCTIEFLPLQPRESTARVTLNSPDLGVYQYDLRLVALPAGPERSLHFKVGLGGSQIQTLRFTSYAKTRTDYTCKIDSTDFLIEKSVSAPAGKLIEPPPVGGVEISVDITYEPSKLGDTRTQLVVSSATGGEYICPLYGHSIAPRPQGPILIKSGSSSTLPFKNMFGSSATFNFVVDNPAFIVKSAETIAPKKTIQLTIGYKQPAAAGAASGGAGAGSSLTSQGQQAGASAAKANSSRVGKLTITHASSNMSWIYYLRHVA